MARSPLALSHHQVRQLRILAQGLPAAPKPPLVATLARTGFVRTLGGSDVYVAARSRVPGTRRQQLDDAVARRDLLISPAVRGCIYLVPAAEAALCLSVAERLGRERDRRDAEKAGIAPGEIERVAELALATLTKHGPSTTDALRRAMPTGSVRSLGERGKKVGVSSPLPQALRRLEFAGVIERAPADGRLDSERYVWRVATTNPIAAAGLPDDPVQLHARLLQRFAANAGVGTLAAFAAWAGIPQRDAKAALAVSGLQPVAIAGDDAAAFAAPDAERLLRSAEAADTAVALLPFEDNLTHLAGGAGWLVDEPFHGLSVPQWGSGKPQPLGEASHMAFRPILAEGRLVGFWEYDPDRRDVVTRCFQPPGRAATTAIVEQAAALGEFLREDLGHGHSFSLDSDDELRRRIAMLDRIGTAPKAPAVRTRRKQGKR